MALRNNNIAINIDAKAGNAVKEFGKLKGSLKGISLGAVAGGVALTAMAVALGSVGKKAIDHAAKLELIQNKSAVVFGEQLPMIQRWAAESSSAFGLTAVNLEGMAAGFADLLVPMEFTRAEAATMTKDVVGLAGAFSEWSAGTRTVEDTTRILARAMLGEREMLKDLGVDIRELDIKQRLMAKGQEELTGNMLKQARATATMEMIFERSKDAQAGFASGGENLTRTTRQVEAAIKEMHQEIVLAMLPAFKKLMLLIRDEIIPIFQDWMPVIKAVATAVAEIVNVVATVGAAIGGFGTDMVAVATGQKDLTEVIEGTNKAMGETFEEISLNEAIMEQHAKSVTELGVSYEAWLLHIEHVKDEQIKLMAELDRMDSSEALERVFGKIEDSSEDAVDSIKRITSAFSDLTAEQLATKLATDILTDKWAGLYTDIEYEQLIQDTIALLKTYQENSKVTDLKELLLISAGFKKPEAAKAVATGGNFDAGTAPSSSFTKENILKGFGWTDNRHGKKDLSAVDFGTVFAQKLVESTNLAAKQGAGPDSMSGAGLHFKGLSSFFNEVFTDRIFTPETFTTIGKTILDQFGGIRAVTGADVQKSAENHFYIQTGVGDPVAIGNEILRLIQMNPQYQAGTVMSGTR
jgi:hypothetical protein